jgi:hypothetical protein
MRLAELFADPIRRDSDEVCLGSGWTSHAEPGTTYTVYWIASTGEVYGLRHPDVAFGPGAPKPFGAYIPRFSSHDANLEAELLGRADGETIAELHAQTEGPEAARSIERLRERLGPAVP